MTNTAHPKGFIRGFFAAIGGTITWLRRVFTNLLFLLLLLFIGIAIFSKEDQLTIPQGSALRVAPSGFLVDELSRPSGMDFFGGPSGPTEVRVKDLVDAIDNAAKDNRISSLVLELDYLVGANLSKLEEVGAALQRFKAAGKPVYAIGDNYTQAQYFLASHADKIYLNPMGSVLLTGFGIYRNYYKSALDKLEVNFHVFRVGDYKDFIEPYTRDDMSPASRENNQRWLHQLWSEYTEQVTGLRNLPPEAIDTFIDTLPQQLKEHDGSWAEAALANKLVDQLASRRVAIDELREEIGSEDKTDDYKSVDALAYLRHQKLKQIPRPGAGTAKIGLISASGTIIDGEAPAGQIGSETLGELIAKAREKKVNALVLRIDSGGGSAFASEAIRQELLATREANIPVVISMGSVAASGGYWIATGADRIWASPSTITGSIGVFGAFPTFEESLEKLGIYNDGIGTSDLAGAMRIDRPLPESAASLLQQGVENTYARFLRIVAEARGSTPKEVHKIAQGQVWTGRAAQQLGLVDELGNLNDAIAGAAQLADVEDYEVVEIQRELTPGERFLRALADNVDARIEAGIKDNLPLGAWFNALQPSLAPVAELQTYRDPRALYVRCLACQAP
ncbi:signal peptide peptidase SppA [Microbulbifer thermotolerans]|uniref:signal peptide peptidase SppA n=1 Tax=Microbulbifer thermotolerans TaxID=252514 RepID=UPI00224B4F63|nr:signal peptide peptidase SppA [Microbulbifer thermotolerans]MCX2834683.1 signal peptide peptidase SppA [Microbulbifer thermotolerans]